MKKTASLMCLMLAFATLFCACNGDEPVETRSVTESAVATTTTSAPETTQAPVPAPVAKKTYVDFDGTITVTNTRWQSLDIRAFTGDGGYYRIAQGGCVIGEYLITCMNVPKTEDTPEKVCVIKSDLKTGEIIVKRENMSLGHANDVAYNPDDNILVIADCSYTARNKFYILDPDTLEVKGYKMVSGSGNGIPSIAYDEVNKRYIAIGSQNDYIHIYDRNFQLIKEIKAYGMSKGASGESRPDGSFSLQGILTDGTYLYMLEWHGGKEWAKGNTTKESEVKSNILVTDLSTGEHVDTIDLEIKREPEFMGYRNGRFYIGCNNIKWNGMELYQVVITTTKK